MLTHTDYTDIYRRIPLEIHVKLSPTETQRRYLRQLYRLRAQARRMGNYLVARAMADLISRVDARGIP